MRCRLIAILCYSYYVFDDRHRTIVFHRKLKYRHIVYTSIIIHSRSIGFLSADVGVGNNVKTNTIAYKIYATI